MDDLVKIRFLEGFDINTEYIAISEDVYKSFQIVIKKWEALAKLFPQINTEIFSNYIHEDLVPDYSWKDFAFFTAWIEKMRKSNEDFDQVIDRLTLADCVDYEFELDTVKYYGAKVED